VILFLLAVVVVAAYVMLQGGLGAAFAPTPSMSSSVATSSPTPGAEPSPSSSPTDSATPTATATLTARATPKPTPLPAQYRGLKRCSGSQKCFVYVVQRGDTLSGIARRFDTTVPTLRRLNPRLRDDFLRVGEDVKVPPP
jgi:LysM domain